MSYEEVSNRAEHLSYRDKLRLAQLLIQSARKEEEEQNPKKRAATVASSPSDPELVEYVALGDHTHRNLVLADHDAGDAGGV